jgi:hypothetical protein
MYIKDLFLKLGKVYILSYINNIPNSTSSISSINILKNIKILKKAIN